MRYRTILLLLNLIVILITCTNNEEKINIDSIGILVNRQHPFLVDHERILITSNGQNKEIDREKLHDDPDGNTKAYLFENKDDYILIDADGKWFYIKKLTGRIMIDKSYDPFVRKELPKDYMGTFIFINGEKKYKLKKGEPINQNKMYRYVGGDL